jgi:hypothetical protein
LPTTRDWAGRACTSPSCRRTPTLRNDQFSSARPGREVRGRR